MNNPLPVIDKTWTLFLDRDGVININKEGGYILHREEFFFTEGAIEAICRLGRRFGRIIIVTNQRGVGKGLMSEADLADIHAFLQDKIGYCGGHIDAIYVCTSVDDHHPDRKPNTGMAMKAKEEFPDIEFSKSVMVGDKDTDVQWGKAIGAFTVRIPSRAYPIDETSVAPDNVCNSLLDFSYWVVHRT